MNIVQNIVQGVREFVSAHKKLTLIGVFGVIIILFFWRTFGPKASTVQYQTAQVTKGTLVVSLSESGSVAASNRQPITTAASGVVSDVDVKNGDVVVAGQTIAKVALDTTSQQKSAAAWASYLSAQNSVAAAQANVNTLQATLFKTNQAFLNDRGIANPTDQDKADPVYIQENDAWLAAEAAYKNQQNVIAADQSALSSAWISYQQASGIITAPIGGTITDLTVAPGMQIAANTSTTTVSSQTVASIETKGNPVVSVTLSELDATKIQAGQKATVTFDAFPNQTFAGKVLGVNTSGTISSGVTTYPATILLDTPSNSILSNMTATANIILDVKPDVLLVPSSAVQTLGGQSMVRVMQNGSPVETPVTVGESSDTETQIVSGLSEGQTVVTAEIGSTGATSSPFSGTRSFGGGGATFIRAAGR